MYLEPQKEHQWLQKLVGEWTYEAEAPSGPDHPAETVTGTEQVRSLDGIWIIAEGRGEMPCGGGDATTIMTLGYNPQTHRYTGTWVGSVMSHLWVYDGELDAAEQRLTLNSEGPSMTDETKTAKYRDIIELKSADQRLLIAEVLGDDGQWHHMMTTTYQRKH